MKKTVPVPTKWSSRGCFGPQVCFVLSIQFYKFELTFFSMGSFCICIRSSSFSDLSAVSPSSPSPPVCPTPFPTLPPCMAGRSWTVEASCSVHSIGLTMGKGEVIQELQFSSLSSQSLSGDPLHFYGVIAGWSWGNLGGLHTAPCGLAGLPDTSLGHESSKAASLPTSAVSSGW